eukprot:m.110266 g.110266  ORF g.110266 m.110266 type:complete len:63 (-) comp13394_c0_seq2:20-208(-)
MHPSMRTCCVENNAGMLVGSLLVVYVCVQVSIGGVFNNASSSQMNHCVSVRVVALCGRVTCE